jgi:hypothetical protein
VASLEPEKMPTRTRGGFSDDVPEFDRQMGCMAGIFQIFDRRRRLITGLRGGRQAQNRLPPPPASGTGIPAYCFLHLSPALCTFDDFTYLTFWENPLLFSLLFWFVFRSTNPVFIELL